MNGLIKQLVILAIIIGVIVGIANYMGNSNPGEGGSQERGVVETMVGKPQIDALQRTKNNTDLIQMKAMFQTEIQRFQFDKGRLPDSLDELVQSGMSRSHLTTPSGQQVHYKLIDNGKRAKIWTYGLDNTGGTKDDVEIYVP